MPDRELLVRIIGDDRDLQRAFANSEKRAGQFESRFTRLNQSLRGGLAGTGIGARGSLLFGSGAFIGTAAITAALTKSVQEASALNEEISKSEQIFGDASESVVEWSQTTARSIGVSQRSALEATGTFGNLFRVVELAPDLAAEMSRELVQLAADLASFNNADPTEVLQALRSGLIGEAEPLRRFGVLLSETRVQQRAMADTGKNNAKALTDQEKALARYEIILQDTAPAQGDVARTAGSLANQSRRLRANLDDLSGNIGTVLIPVLTDATEAANLLFVALDKFRGVDFSPGFDFPEPPDWLRSASIAPISPLGAVALGVKRALDNDDKDLGSVTDQINSQIGKGIAELQEALNKRSDAIKKINARDVKRSKQAFDEFVKGMGLKLDRAGLTAALGDDVAALRELEAAILRRMEIEGRTFQLVQLLTDTRLQIQSLVEQQADDAKQAGEDAFNATVDALNLGLEIAQATKSFADDQAALRAIEQAILKRIQSEGATTDLLRQLFQVRQEQADVARQIREQRAERRQEDQFGALGLTEEGEKPTPGVGALRRRLKTLRDQVRGTTLDTEKTRRELDRIAEVLTDKFGAVGKEVRDAILGMFNDIASALDEGGKGPLTKTSGLNTKKVLEGLGLTDQQINELRGRLSSVNTAGRQLAAVQSTVPGTTLGGRGTPTGNIVLESTVNVNLDGQQIAKVVTKQQQKARRRNPPQKRGPNRGGQ